MSEENVISRPGMMLKFESIFGSVRALRLPSYYRIGLARALSFFDTTDDPTGALPTHGRDTKPHDRVVHPLIIRSIREVFVDAFGWEYRVLWRPGATASRRNVPQSCRLDRRRLVESNAAHTRGAFRCGGRCLRSSHPILPHWTRE